MTMYRKIYLLALILTLTALFVWLLIPKTVASNQTQPEATHASSTEIKVATSTSPTPKVQLYSILKPVCSCESNGRPDTEPSQYRDGKVIVGKINPNDIGMCQINTTYHLADAQKLGLDIYTEEGNIRYANYLYDHQGLKPWSWSKHCWAKSLGL